MIDILIDVQRDGNMKLLRVGLGRNIPPCHPSINQSEVRTPLHLPPSVVTYLDGKLPGVLQDKKVYCTSVTEKQVKKHKQGHNASHVQSMMDVIR